MKKILSSLGFVVVFTAYVVYQYLSGSSGAIAATTSFNVPSATTTSVEPNPSLVPQPPATPTISAPQPTPTLSPKVTGQYIDGSYTGTAADAYYGYIQVKAVITGGKIADVLFLQYPNDRNTSVRINGQALPHLKQEAITVQNAQVDIVSGATDSSLAFRESLASALAQAKS